MSLADPFRIAFVPGVTPDKWLNRWRERLPRSPLEAFLVERDEQRAVLLDGRAHMSFVRLPVDRAGLHVIPLYAELSVVVMGAEHVLSLLDEVAAADLADELVNDGPDRLAIETAAAGTGVVVVPQSVARLYHRKDVTTRPYVDAEESEIGLAWRTDLDDGRTDEFVGIVRGRTAHSSRGEEKPAAPKKAPTKKAPTKKAPARKATPPKGRRTSRRR